MTLSDPVGAGEIARRAGVAKATVWSWQKRHSDFPAPVQLEMGPVWDWAEVESWLRERRGCPDCRGKGTVSERAHSPNGTMHSEFTCLGCNGTGYAVKQLEQET